MESVQSVCGRSVHFKQGDVKVSAMKMADICSAVFPGVKKCLDLRQKSNQVYLIMAKRSRVTAHRHVLKVSPHDTTVDRGSSSCCQRSPEPASFSFLDAGLNISRCLLFFLSVRQLQAANSRHPCLTGRHPLSLSSRHPHKQVTQTPLNKQAFIHSFIHRHV